MATSKVRGFRFWHEAWLDPRKKKKKKKQILKFSFPKLSIKYFFGFKEWQRFEWHQKELLCFDEDIIKKIISFFFSFFLKIKLLISQFPGIHQRERMIKTLLNIEVLEHHRSVLACCHDKLVQSTSYIPNECYSESDQLITLSVSRRNHSSSEDQFSSPIHRLFSKHIFSICSGSNSESLRARNAKLIHRSIMIALLHQLCFASIFTSESDRGPFFHASSRLLSVGKGWCLCDTAASSIAAPSSGFSLYHSDVPGKIPLKADDSWIELCLDRLSRFSSTHLQKWHKEIQLREHLGTW